MANYNEITNRTSPNKWVGGNTIKSCVIHHWGDPAKNPTAEGVVNWLCNPASQVSAHFVITGTGRRVWQLVADKDRAWHAMAGNNSTLGLELDPRCRNEDYDVAAEVIADLWRYYGKLPLQPHKYWVNTACPGNYDLGRLHREAEAKLNPPKPDPTPKPTTLPVPDAEKLPKPLKFTAKLDATNVWDLTTNPNYKAVTTLKKGAGFEAYAQIKFNNSIYYVTRYSYDKKLKNGINQIDLVPVQTVTPPVTPKPTPEPEPSLPVAEKPEYAQENNALLKQILTLVQSILTKITSVFK